MSKPLENPILTALRKVPLFHASNVAADVLQLPYTNARYYTPTLVPKPFERKLQVNATRMEHQAMKI